MHISIFKSILVAIFIVSASRASADSVIEAKLKALNLCAGLRAEVDIVVRHETVGIDRLKELRLETFDLKLRGDHVSISATGMLTCATSEAAVFNGDAGMRVEASSEVDLSSCQIVNLRLSATEFYGSFRNVVRALWAPLIELKIDSEARAQIKRACHDFKADK